MNNENFSYDPADETAVVREHNERIPQPSLEGSLLNYLSFCCYRANRNGGMKPEHLAEIFGVEQGARMEAAYRLECV